MKTIKMLDGFFNWFLQQAFFPIAQSSSNTTNIKKNWPRCQKLAEDVSFYFKYSDLHLKENSVSHNHFFQK